jgi:hypothetical protein
MAYVTISEWQKKVRQAPLKVKLGELAKVRIPKK